MAGSHICVVVTCSVSATLRVIYVCHFYESSCFAYVTILIGQMRKMGKRNHKYPPRIIYFCSESHTGYTFI